MRIKLLSLVLLCVIRFNAQVSTPFNNGIPANYVGWAPANPFPLRIEHQGNQSIIFATNSFTRMILDNGNASQTGGRLSLGNNLPSNFAPQSRIHIHQTGIANNNINVRFNLKMYLS